MSRIMQAWEALLRDAISTDYDKQQNALFQIGLILQRHNPHVVPDSDIYEESLSRELLRLTLNETRQTDTVIYLLQLVKNHPKQADSFFFSLSNTQPKILIEPLLTLLQEIGAKLNTAAAYQALIALEGAIRNRGDAIIPTLKVHDISALLNDWAGRKDDLLAEKAKNVDNRIKKLIGG
ncbi:MAG: hypothetical protein Q9P01_12060 [Anaerolineae bacterium]|nr:hypothetical protein [Anaerolineae bacterium]MDQ7035533.1 hypothetical protein [Anaerolineae bacterium]